MMKEGLIFLVVLLSLGFVFAEPVVTYTVIDDMVLSELRLDSGTKVVVLPFDAEIIEINSDYSLDESSLGKIFVTEATNIDYRSEAHIEKGDTSSFFVSRNPLEVPLKVVLVLPSRSTFSDTQLVFPKNFVLSTNGENIIVTWGSVSDDLLLEYSHPSRSGFWNYVYIGVGIVILFLVYFLYVRKRFGEKTLTANLYRDEKKIISYLSGKKERSSWTKDLVRDLGISKVTLSRKLRILEEKGLISREPHGNENRISLKK